MYFDFVYAHQRPYTNVFVYVLFGVYTNRCMCAYTLFKVRIQTCVSTLTYTNNEILRMRAPYWFVYVHFMFLYNARIRSNMCVYEHNESSYTNFAKVRIRTMGCTYTCKKDCIRISVKFVYEKFFFRIRTFLT